MAEVVFTPNLRRHVECPSTEVEGTTAPDGDQLGFGSSTGNLWVTANQGDAWHQVATSLPPVHAVRYV